MNIFFVIGLVTSAAVLCNAQPPTKVGNCANHYPKKGCELLQGGLCSDSCGWGEALETYTCDNGVFTCDRPCFMKKCLNDPAIVDTSDLSADCIRVMFSKCSRPCGNGIVYESFLCSDGIITAKKPCCCESCPPSGSGIRPPVLCRDIPTIAHMCPHLNLTSPSVSVHKP